MIASILASLLAVTATQSVDELKAACDEYQAEYGGGADCQCLAEKVAGDEDLLAMFVETEIETPEDLAEAPEELLEAIAECTD